MNKDRNSTARSNPDARLYLRVALGSMVFALFAMAVLSVRINTKASSFSNSNTHNSTVSASPEGTPASNVPPQTAARRINVNFGEKKDMPLATGVDSFVLVSPEIATVEIKSRFLLTITPLKRGETILLIKFGHMHQTFIIQVVSPPPDSARRDALIAENRARNASTSGSFTTMFSPGLGGGSSFLRQSLDYRRKLSNGRTLRIGAEMLRMFGNTDRSSAVNRIQNFSLNRISVGVDTAKRSIDVVDSQVNISPLSLNNFTMRGFHMVMKPTVAQRDNLKAKGLEVYVGLARPSLGFFDTNGGKIAGAMIPVKTTDYFRARGGLIAISAEKNSRQARGGVVFQADVAYAPKKEIFADAEMSFANGGLSWRARLDLNYLRYGGSAEITRFSISSPLNSIGARYGGQKNETVSLYWRPGRNLTTSGGYNHSSVTRLSNSYLADFDRSLLFANASFAVTKGLRLTLRYSEQKIDTAFPGGQSKFAIETRTVSVGNTLRIGPHLSNTIEGRINFDREANADEALETGFSFSEQLRLGWQGGSLTGFLNYNRKSPSLTSMIVRNPGLLTPTLQAAFAMDPAEFLRFNRDRIAFLLGGVDPPETRSIDSGIQFQKTFSRFNISAEARYNAGEVYAITQNAVYTSASAGVRLDRANSIQLNGWTSVTGGGRSGMTVSYTHQFGASSEGFQFSSLLGLNRGKVRGRVFYDLNGNGQYDFGEPGLAGIKIQIDGKRSVVTDKEGRYELSANGGRHVVVLASPELGVRLLASTPTEQTVEIDGQHKLDLNFGVSDHGSISGRVVNYLGPPQESQAQDPPGLSGVKVTLRSDDNGLGSFVLEQLTSADGAYIFADLRPGKYLVEIDPATLPPNYNIPGITGSTVLVEPLHSSRYDISITAQRAVTGTVYIDRNGDGIYTNKIDDPVQGASVSVNNSTSISGSDGSYILRNLPAGTFNLVVHSPSGSRMVSTRIELGPAPLTRRSLDLVIEGR